MVKKLGIGIAAYLSAITLFTGMTFNISAQDSGGASFGKDSPVRITEEHKARAAELVSKMTLEEKIDYISSVKSFVLRPVERLGIPEIKMADGPQGIRNNTISTLYPSGILTAATFNRELANRLGHSLGQDAKARGVAVLLGPGVNIYRAPQCGRNYEYMGEDPFLTSETAKQYILGVQAEGVLATVKHFVANNQLEHVRHSVSSDVDERTLNEIYFPAFRKAVQEAGVASVMDSYNLVWGCHSTENPWLNIEVLRNQWGFDGIVMSDWTSVYSTLGAANGGLDLECPKGVYFTKERLLPLIESGAVSEKTIDEKVQHLLQTFIAFGLLDRPMQDKSIPLDNPQSCNTALDIAREGVVLLENRNGCLPISKKSKILVMGPNATEIPTGGGSGFVTPYSTVSVYDGMKTVHGEKKVTLLSDEGLYRNILPWVYADSTYAVKGFRADYYCNNRPEGKIFKTVIEENPTHYWKYGSPFEGMPADGFSVVWNGVLKAEVSGKVRVRMSGDDGYRLFVNGENVGGHWSNHSLSSRSVFFDIEKGKTYSLKFEFFDNAGEGTVVFDAGVMDKEKLVKALGEATDVVFCAGFNSSSEGEGFDRPFAMPKDQTDLINLVSSLHDKVSVIVNAGGGVDFNGWSENVESVLMAWYPGQEGGRAIAEVLTGKISPSGRLPVSIENKWEDNPVFNSYYDKNKRVTYTEGVYVGYRGYAKSGISPKYPFGYGLSYSSFSYDSLKIEKTGVNKAKVSFVVTNTGNMDAAEVIQIYVGDNESSVKRPVIELKEYSKIFLKKGESRSVSLNLGEDAFSFFDVDTKRFIVEPGVFTVYVGHSSADLVLKGEVDLSEIDDKNIRLTELLSKMTVEEKVGQLVLVSGKWDLTGPTEGKEYLDDIRSGKCGNVFNVLTVENIRKLQKVAVEESRLGIPLLFGYDEVHGYKTIFPIPLAESCSWNLDAIEKSARTGAVEASASGLNWVYAPMVDISYDPRWGRVAEGAGEDPWLGSLIAAARVKGIQGKSLADSNTVMACVKHYAAYGAPIAGREYNTVDMSDRQFREVYLPPYAAAVSAGAGSVMTSFNEFDGIPATANKYLLEDILRNELGFKGLVVTDFSSMAEMIAHGYSEDVPHAALQSIEAGVDMDMMGDVYYKALADLVKSGKVPESLLDRAVMRVLEAKESLGLFDDPYRYCNLEREKNDVRTGEHLKQARQSACESMVLLENDGILPLAEGEKIAVIGSLATTPGDYIGCWSAQGFRFKDISILEALYQRAGKENVFYARGCDVAKPDTSGFATALDVASKADKVVFVMGESRDMSGEAAARSDIRIPGVQTDLLKRLVEAGNKVAVVLVNGRPLDLSRESVLASAILEAWCPGSMGGPAVADVLYNDYNPSGKLTMTFPRSIGQVPMTYAEKNTGRPNIGKGKYLSRYIDIPNSPLYPFGHGLSYTTFSYGEINLSSPVLEYGGAIRASVKVANTGHYEGTEIVQMYIRDLCGSVTRPVKQLKGFKRITLKPGESREVVFDITPETISFLRQDMTWGPEPGDFNIFIGSSSDSGCLKSSDFKYVQE